MLRVVLPPLLNAVAGAVICADMHPEMNGLMGSCFTVHAERDETEILCADEYAWNVRVRQPSRRQVFDSLDKDDGIVGIPTDSCDAELRAGAARLKVGNEDGRGGGDAMVDS